MIHTIATQPESTHPLNPCNDLYEDRMFSHRYDYIPCAMDDCKQDVEKNGDYCEECQRYCEEHA